MGCNEVKSGLYRGEEIIFASREWNPDRSWVGLAKKAAEVMALAVIERKRVTRIRLRSSILFQSCAKPANLACV
jgi:hypothetical protein